MCDWVYVTGNKAYVFVYSEFFFLAVEFDELVQGVGGLLRGIVSIAYPMNSVFALQFDHFIEIENR